MSTGNARTVVVTGGTAGIGRATAREFARHGCKVAVLARGKDGLDATRRDIEELGGSALSIPTDVADWNAVEAAADQVEREFGPIDVWVNNAFAGIFSRFMDVTPEEYERVTNVTYIGQVNGTRAALKRMLPRDSGAIVLVGSALAYRGIPLQSAYCGSKHAIQGFINSVRCELLHDKSNVTITMVQMPGVNTPQFDWIRARLPGQPRPVGKVYQPEVAARAIYFAANDGRKEMLVGVPTVEAVWGNKIASSMMDDYLAATGFASQQRPERVAPTAGTICSNRSRAITALTAASTARRSTAAPSCGSASIRLTLASPLWERRRLRAPVSCSPERQQIRAEASPQDQGAELSLACTRSAGTIAPSAARRRCRGSRRRDRARVAASARLAPVGGAKPACCRSTRRRRRDPVPERRPRQRDRALPRPVQGSRDVRGSDNGGARPCRRVVDSLPPAGCAQDLPRVAFATVGVTGLIGLGFHTYNILKRPGRTGCAQPVLRRPDGSSGGPHARRALRSDRR